MNDQPSNREELMTRWIDRDLSAVDAAAFEQELNNNPDLRKEVEAAQGLGKLLRSELPASQEPPYPELFNSQIMKRIKEAEPGSDHVDTKIIQPPSGVWLRLPWLIAGAAVLMAGFIVLQKPKTADVVPMATSETMNTYAPRDGVVVRTRVSPEASATVLSLEGLDDIPSDHEIDGELVASYLPVAPGEAPVFASSENGQPVFVLTNGFNGPSVVRLTNDGTL